MSAPKTLRQLLRLAAAPLWKGKAYERTAYRNVEEFIEIVGDLDLPEVKTVTMDKWEAALTVSPATINRKMVNIHQVLAYAVDRDWMLKLPKMDWHREPEGRIRWLSTTEEVQMFALLDEWQCHEEARFITVLLETAMRRGELLDAQASQVDGEWLRLWKTKTKKARSVPLSPRAQAALKDALPWKLDENRLRQVWDRLREAMGLQNDPDFVLHMLRHTQATRTLSKTKNIVVVQRLLGHSDIKTTLRYAHLSDDELLAAVQ
jgi:integrase